jgi:cell division septation protein DedD
MKRTWLVWTLVGGVLVTVLIAFNYERGKEAVPLSEIFPEKGALDREVEYEFFDTDEKGSALVSTAETRQQSIRPAQPSPTVAAKAPAASTPTTKQPAVSSGSVAKPKAASAATTGAPMGPAAGGGSGKIYTIQVAAFKERSRADKAVAQAQQKGYSAYVDERSRDDSSTWYQVCIGKFDAQSPAKELLTKVKQDYKDGFIRILSGR